MSVCCRMSGQAMLFKMCAGDGLQPSIVQAALYLSRTKSQLKTQPQQDGWKAVISLRGKRRFGNWRSTIVEAVDAVLEKYAHKISDSEERRIH